MLNRRDFTALSLLALPALPALAQPSAAFNTLATPVATPAGKIEVLEFFWYGCPHCYAIEPAVISWEAKLPDDVVFRKVPAVIHGLARVHQPFFFALEAMGVERQLRPAIFTAMHRDRQMLNDLPAMQKFVAAQGVDANKFADAYRSFGVATKSQQTMRLQEQYKLEGVPLFTVAGRFTTSPALAGKGAGSDLAAGTRALEVVDALVQRVRRG